MPNYHQANFCYFALSLSLNRWQVLEEFTSPGCQHTVQRETFFFFFYFERCCNDISRKTANIIMLWINTALVSVIEF